MLPEVTAAPVWLSYASPAIALLALVVAGATYRRAGPRVWARAYISTLPADSPEKDLLVTLRLSNHGLAAQDILSAHWGFSYTFLTVKALLFEAEDISVGEGFPLRLDGRSTRTWVLSLRKPLDRYVASGKIPSLSLRAMKFHPLGITIFGIHRHIPAVAIAVDLGTNQVEARLNPLATYRVMRFLEAYAEAPTKSITTPPGN